MLERAIYTEEEFEELPVQYTYMWEFMDEVSKNERVALLARKERSFFQGGGGWPSTTARSS